MMSDDGSLATVVVICATVMKVGALYLSIQINIRTADKSEKEQTKRICLLCALMEAAASSLFGEDDDETLDIDNKQSIVEDAAPQLLDKFFLLNPSQMLIERYLELIKELLIKGDGEALIEIGYSWEGNSNERGLPLQDLEKAVSNNSEILKSHGFIVNSHATVPASNDLYTKMVLVRQPFDDVDFIEVRVAVVGNVDAGKSTLLGVLTHGVLDDGRGHARQKLFRHKHEFESGRTSSVGNDILGFDIHGDVVNKPDPHKHQLDWVNICRMSAKVVTFIDLAGHEKYLKTTIFGMTGHMPDYTMLMIGANAGIIGTTREHLSLALSLGVPVFIVVTKIDMCPKPVLEETLKNLNKLMKSARKRPVLITNSEDVVHAATNFTSAKICPVFQVSNVAGTNLPLLKEFLNIVPLHRTFSASNPTEFQIDDIYWVDGVGTVVSGTCLSGRISLGDNLLLGPNSIGEFTTVPIKSIHRKRMPVTTVKCGQTASFALRKQTKKEVRKGMVLVSPEIDPQSCFQFDAEVLILHHPTTIATNYQAMVHVGSVRQTATIVSLDKDVLRTGDRGIATFKFIRQPEYLRVGTKMVFREGRTKAVGTIVKIFPHQSAIAAKSSRHQKKKELHQQSRRHVVQKVTS
uniref:Tr-type G domain-containing protein n=1 Tax=Steinernema glaseri TaxID=37863 RepID=A0A1I7ZAY0_9BILA